MLAMTPGLVRSSTPPFQFQKKRRTFRLLNCRAENYSQILRSSVSDVATCVVHCKGKLWQREQIIETSTSGQGQLAMLFAVTYVGRRWLRGAHATAAVGPRTLVWFPLPLQFSIRSPTFQFHRHVSRNQPNQLRPRRFRQDRRSNQIRQALS